MHFRVTMLAAIGAGLLAGPAFAQSVNTPAPYVRFDAHVVARTPSYVPVASGTALIFDNDQIGIEVSLVNKTRENLRLGGPDYWWIGDVQVSMMAVPRDGVSRPVAVSFTTEFGDEAPLFTLSPEGVAIVDLRVRPSAPLAPGFYRLTVTLGGVLAKSAPDGAVPVSRELRLEVRSVATLEERLDDLLQQAFFASRERHFDEAEMWASRAVAAHPFSVIALADVASAWRFNGRCMEGVPMLRRAIGIMDRGGDPLLVHPLPDTYSDALRTVAARCEDENR